jgi:recombination protein RecA
VPGGPAPIAEQVRRRSREPAEERKERDEVPSSVDPETLIPTGSTMLDLALSDHAEGGYQMGRIDLLIGNSDSGKTVLALTEFAECATRRRFDDYRFIGDWVETNSGIDIPRLLGRKVAGRIEPPREDEDGEPLYSDTIQDFHDNVIRALEDGRPFLYIVDSVDALSSEEEQEKLEEQREAREKEKEVKGTFGGEKPKVAGQLLRNVKKRIRDSRSHVLCIFQTRDNIGAMPGQSKQRYSGGRAWKFYAQHEVWLKSVGQHVDKKTRLKTGVKSEADVTKNHLTGKKRSAAFDIFYDYGVDTLGGEVDFLVEAGIIRKAGAYLDPRGLAGMEERLYREDLIRVIERDGLERRVRRAVQQAWHEREESIKLGRKPRFE